MDWSCLLNTELKNSQIRKLMKTYTTIESVYNNIDKLNDEIKRKIEKCREYENSDKDLRIISYYDDEYPDFLRQIEDFPTFLFLKGKKLPANWRVAIVGTRKYTNLGEKTCRHIINGLSKYENISTISGLAKGIDTIAHKASLENNIHTIAVLPTSIYDCYPSENKELKDEIERRGTLISEFRKGEVLQKYNFVIRNRIIAAISNLVYIPQSYKSGGSLITAKLAGLYNKEIYASPGSIFDKSFEGCNNLIMKNEAKLVLNASDIAYEYCWREKSEKIFGNS